MMNSSIQNVISKTSQLCKTMLDLEGQIEQIDTLVNGTPQYVAQITDENIATVPSFAQAGITAAEVLAAIYCIKTARAAFMANLPAVTIVANL